METARKDVCEELTLANEATWLQIGGLNEMMGEFEQAAVSYQRVLNHNPQNPKASIQLANLHVRKEEYQKAIESLEKSITYDKTHGDAWAMLGHCYLRIGELHQAYNAYQHALIYLTTPRDPNLWYGIGVLYERFQSFDHAEEAFNAVLKMDEKFDKTQEIYFKLALLSKQKGNYGQANKYLSVVLKNLPSSVRESDVYFHIGHIFELQKMFDEAKETYEKALQTFPPNAKVLQQLGWLYHQNTPFINQKKAVDYLLKSIDADPSEAQTWYLLGRCYMAQAAIIPYEEKREKANAKYRKAYEAYQQAVYRDRRNPIFWCSIGVLYYRIHQYRDALDAYSRAIQLNPYLSEVWYDLGALYESCNQLQDSLHAYQKALELDPNNRDIQERLRFLNQMQQNGDVEGNTQHQGADAKNQSLPAILSHTDVAHVHHPHMSTNTSNATKPSVDIQGIQVQHAKSNYEDTEFSQAHHDGVMKGSSSVKHNKIPSNGVLMNHLPGLPDISQINPNGTSATKNGHQSSSQNTRQSVPGSDSSTTSDSADNHSYTAKARERDSGRTGEKTSQDGDETDAGREEMHKSKRLRLPDIEAPAEGCRLTTLATLARLTDANSHDSVSVEKPNTFETSAEAKQVQPIGAFESPERTEQLKGLNAELFYPEGQLMAEKSENNVCNDSQYESSSISLRKSNQSNESQSKSGKESSKDDSILRNSVNGPEKSDSNIIDHDTPLAEEKHESIPEEKEEKENSNGARADEEGKE